MQQQISSLGKHLITFVTAEHLLPTVQPLVVQQRIDPSEILAALVAPKPFRFLFVHFVVRFQVFRRRKALPANLTLESFALFVP